jgi:hypothetical protein
MDCEENVFNLDRLTWLPTAKAGNRMDPTTWLSMIADGNFKP